MVSYTSQVAAIHRQFKSSLERARTRQSVLNAYWKHKRDHEKLLRRHLKEEEALVKKVKARLDYR